MTPARRVTAVTVPVDGGCVVALGSFPGRPPLLSLRSPRPGLLVTLALPERVDAGQVRFARDLAAQARRYAIEVERAWRGLPPPRHSHPARLAG